ncbi:DNA (cytosine-5-)-methyltransferase [Isoptericola sp. b408]|uniref:DNA (cytosine-5-)-methyltransferase n=1 Tax=Isoptericola sp. b408 TaxID=3064653 RepID=UPI0027125C0D|nr:DNA (cytosine-5-)-methyltransferase [Isoptericola sp. b408]MDO8150200.1 DNA (cytosine-5-)-methyltransferase [Isoptericola sp. b408]
MPTESGASFTFIDLFAGIGGFHAALEPLGGRCVYASEMNGPAWRVYTQAWGVPEYEGKPSYSRNIRDHVGSEAEESLPEGPERDLPDIPDHDVLTAGFPCQAFSKSGKQDGILDATRGTLFHDILRIVRARRPKVVFLENVKNLAGPKHRKTTFATIIAGLKQYGYVVAGDPTVVSPHRMAPQHGGTPQVRERIYIMAIRRDLVSDGAIPFQGFRYSPWDPDLWNLHELKLPAIGGRTILDRSVGESDGYGLKGEEQKALVWWEALLTQIIKEAEEAEGVPPRSGRWMPGHPIWYKTLDEDWRKAQEADARARDLTWKLDFLKKNQVFFSNNGDALERVEVQPDPDKFTGLSRTKFEWQAGLKTSVYDCLIQFRPSGIRVRPATYTPALVAINQTPVYGPWKRRLTPREVGRLQAFPERVADAMVKVKQGDGESYKQFGNAVHVGAVRFALAQFLSHFADKGLDESLRPLMEKARTAAGLETAEVPRAPSQGTLDIHSAEESDAA